MTDPEPKYAPIRSLSRGLLVLQTINQEGSATLSTIGKRTNLPYPTVFRIVQTLMQDGYVEAEPHRKSYRASIVTKSLSSGFQDDSLLTSVARPHIVRLTERFAWPISIATRVGNMMMVRDSTHRLTSLTLSNYAPGFTLPIAECSSGKVFLSYCGDDERASIRKGLSLLQGPADRVALLLTENDALVNSIRAKGYATQVRNNYTNNPGKTSSISVPIMQQDRIFGAMAIVFFTVGLRMEDAEARFVPAMREAADEIGAELARSL